MIINLTNYKEKMVDNNLFEMGRSIVQEDESAFFTEAPDESRINVIPEGKSFIIKD